MLPNELAQTFDKQCQELQLSQSEYLRALVAYASENPQILEQIVETAPIASQKLGNSRNHPLSDNKENHIEDNEEKLRV